MDKKTVTVFACVLILTAFALPGSATGQEDVERLVVFSVEDGALVPGGQVPAGANQVECNGNAPDESYCNTGLHVAGEVWAIGAGASFTYTGTTEVRLFHATSVLVMQVHWIDGDFAGGQLYGQFPSSPSVFWHECFSYELGAAGDNPIPLPFEENGTPGGSGDWGCTVLYP